METLIFLYMLKLDIKKMHNHKTLSEECEDCNIRTVNTAVVIFLNMPENPFQKISQKNVIKFATIFFVIRVAKIRQTDSGY